MVSADRVEQGCNARCVDVVGDLRSRLGSYPGRGLGLFRGPNDGIRWIYFLTGRSAASRSRRFRVADGSLVVEATDESTTHDSLRHYVCAALVNAGERLVIGNGEHVQHIASALGAGGTPEAAAADLEPEPDPPIFTPRISLVVGASDALSIVVRRGPDGNVARRVAQVTPRRSELVVLHTYGGSLESPYGSAPEFRLALSDDLSPTNALWSALDPDLRVMMCEGSSTTAAPSDWWLADSELK